MLGTLAKSTRISPATMLPVDLPGKARRQSAMPEDTDDLIRHLCTRVGMIMEDASVVALMMERADEKKIRELEEVSQRIAALIAAAAALLA